MCSSKHVEPSIKFGIINSVTKLNLVGISTEYYNLTGPPSYMRSVVDRNVVKRRKTVYHRSSTSLVPSTVPSLEKVGVTMRLLESPRGGCEYRIKTGTRRAWGHPVA